MRKIIKLIVFLLLMLGIPVGTTFLFYKNHQIQGKQQLSSGISIEMNVNDRTEELDLEEYLIGLLPNQIDVDCEIETMKAQAVIARTNVLKQMEEKESNSHEQLGFTFTSRSQMEQTWGKQKAAKYRYKIEQAISTTFGQSLQYNNQYIDALYHSISVGETVSAQEYLGKKVPYLISVDSSRDIEAPGYLTVKEWKPEEIVDTLNEYSIKVTKSMVVNELSIGEQTEMGYVKTVKIGDRSILGEDFREIFHLNSTNFYFDQTKNKIRITTVGKGHGMGVSQYGANLLALDGDSYQTILNYYYPGTSLAAY